MTKDEWKSYLQTAGVKPRDRASETAAAAPAIWDQMQVAERALNAHLGGVLGEPRERDLEAARAALSEMLESGEAWFHFKDDGSWIEVKWAPPQTGFRDFIPAGEGKG